MYGGIWGSSNFTDGFSIDLSSTTSSTTTLWLLVPGLEHMDSSVVSIGFSGFDSVPLLIIGTGTVGLTASTCLNTAVSTGIKTGGVDSAQPIVAPQKWGWLVL